MDGFINRETVEREEVTSLCASILHAYYEEGNEEFLISKLTEDVTWHGGGKYQQANGYEEVADWFRNAGKQFTDLVMSEEHYHYMKLAEGIYLCRGCSDLDFCDADGNNVRSHQCTTVVFRREADELRVSYIHSSIPAEHVNDSISSQALLQAKKEQQRSEQRFIYSVSKMYDRIYEADLYSDIIYVWKENDRLYDSPVAGGSLKSYLKNVQREHLHPDYLDAFERWADIEAVIKSFEAGDKEHSLELLVGHPDKGYRWIKVIVQVLEINERSLRVMVYEKDIHDTKHEDFMRQQQTLEAIQLMKGVSSAYDMIISANLTKNSYYMISYAKFLNRTALDEGVFDDLIAAGVSTIPDSDKQAFYDAFSRESLLKAYRDGQTSVYLEHQQLGDDGGIHWMSTHVMFTYNPYNDDVMEITLSRCIDDVREKEERNRRVLSEALSLAEQSNSAKTDFLSKMSHDIRTPMNAIMGMTAIASMSMNEPDTIKECLDKINVSSQYLLGLIDDVLDMSQIESGKMSVVKEVFNFREMLQSIMSIMEVQTLGKHQTFNTVISEAVECCYVSDKLRLRQILTNLLSNAHKYTDDGGNISLEIYPVNINSERAVMRFVVKDNGIGIKEEFLERIFEPFTKVSATAGEGGSGLGLAITQNLVHLLNGNISVKSRLGEGSCFTVEIPLTRVSHEEEAVHKPIAPTDEDSDAKITFAGERILIVEDNDINREIASRLLRKRNLTVETATNGKEAVDMFLASPKGYYSLILMDIQMPVMNGYEATRLIREGGHPDAVSIPVYALSANAYPRDAALSISSGMNGHISKPVNFDEVFRIISRELKRRMM